MPSPLSVDLRERVVAAVAAGASWYGVSVSSASRWAERFAREGHVGNYPGCVCGDGLS